MTVAPLQASWLLAVSWNWIVGPVHVTVVSGLPIGTSAFTVAVMLLSVKSLAPQVPVGAPPALVTEEMLAVTELT